MQFPSTQYVSAVSARSEEIDLVAEPSNFDTGGVIALTKL